LRWIAPTEKDAVDQFRANSGLKAQEYLDLRIDPPALRRGDPME